MMERRSRTDDRSGALSLAAPRADSLGPGALNKARARSGDQQTMKLWGGNYSSDPDAAFWEFNRSFPFDRRLLAEEIAASRAPGSRDLLGQEPPVEGERAVELPERGVGVRRVVPAPELHCLLISAPRPSFVERAGAE